MVLPGCEASKGDRTPARPAWPVLKALFAVVPCLLSRPARARPVGSPVQAECGDRRQHREKGNRVDCAPSEETAGDGAQAVGQKREDLPLGGEAEAMWRAKKSGGHGDHNGGEGAGEDDGGDAGAADLTRRDALDSHTRSAEKEEDIERQARGRLFAEPPGQQKASEEAGFDGKEPGD